MTEVRAATQRDMDEVMAWLLKERRQTGQGFHCNRNIIEDDFRDGRVVVAVDGADPVAFLSGGLTPSGILEVRPDMRGRGLGRLLVERGLREAIGEDRCLLEIECTPISSVPFWMRMGFTLHTENRAHLELSKPLTLPPRGDPVPVTVSFYHAYPRGEQRPAPTSVHYRRGMRDRNGKVHLEARVVCNQYLAADNREDAFAHILVGGEEIYFDKLKRERTKALGVGRDPGFHYYLDAITIPQSPVA